MMWTITSLTWHLLWLFVLNNLKSFILDWWQFNFNSELKFAGFPHVIRFSLFLSFFTRRGRATFPSWARRPRFLCRTRRWCGRSWTCRLKPRSWWPSWPTNLGSEKNHCDKKLMHEKKRKVKQGHFAVKLV